MKGSEEGPDEGSRQVLILAIREDEPISIGPMSTSSYFQANILLSHCILEVFREMTASKKYVFVDWSDLKVISEATTISEISDPGILVLVPKARVSEMEKVAENIKKKTMWGELREEVWKHVESLIVYGSSGTGRHHKNKLSQGSKLTSKERDRCILILAVWRNKVALWPLIISNRDTADALIIPNSIFDGFLPAQVVEDYVLLDWWTLEPIPETTEISRISEQGIVFRLPRAPLPELKRDAISIVKWAMTTHGDTQDYIFQHLTNFRFIQTSEEVPIKKLRGFKMPPLSKSCPFGSIENPFESPQALLSFLEKSEPQKYVFRGQIREYSGPLLPSGYRKWFRPFPVGQRTHGFAGMTYTVSERQKLAKKALEEVVLRPGKYNNVIVDAQRAMNLLEEDFYVSTSDFLPKPELREVEDSLIYTQGQTLVVLSGIVGPQLGQILGQQYGLISTLLDVTTDPKVAMFFANYEYPYYHPVENREELGVIYRWPREVAILAEKFFKPLEIDDFETLGTSIKRYIECSKDLIVGYNIHFELGIRGAPIPQEILPIIVTGDKREFKALVFPKGTFTKSRMGRQRAAFLMPYTKQTDVQSFLLPHEELAENGANQFTLIADIMRTCGGETFYFRHSGQLPNLGPIDKFYLWPDHPKLRIKRDDEGDSTVLEYFQLQDKYMQLLLRFFSPSSPIMLILWFWLRGEKGVYDGPVMNITGEEYELRIPGRIQISTGFAIHPDEVETIEESGIDLEPGSWLIKALRWTVRVVLKVRSHVLIRRLILTQD